MLISFDCYGTLVDWKRAIGEYLKYHFQKDEIVKEFFNCEFSMISRINKYRKYKEILVECLRKVSSREDEGLERGIVLSFTKSPPFPDVYYGLVTLKKKGYKLAVISNTDKDLINITLAGFEDIFDFIVTAEDTGYYKPNSLAFTTAYSIMGVDYKREVIHVSAYPEYDLEPARQLGIRNIMIDRYGYNWSPKVKDLIELARYIEL